AAFFLMAVPVGIVAIYLLRLEEPVRGGTDDAEAAAMAALVAPEKFRAAVRRLHGVRTLRRQFLAHAFLGAALLPLGPFLILYLDRVFHVGPVGRGAIGTCIAIGSLAGVLLAGRLTRLRWLPKGV